MGLRLHGYSCFSTGGLLHLSFTCDSEPLEVAPPPQWDGASGRESSASPSRVAGSEVFVVCVHAVCMPCACCGDVHAVCHACHGGPERVSVESGIRHSHIVSIL